MMENVSMMYEKDKKEYPLFYVQIYNSYTRNHEYDPKGLWDF